MPRRLRLHMPGGFYHVTLRGNHQQAIFFSDADRLLMKDIVSRAVQKFSARLHAYCWMGNHIHLLLQAGVEPISRPMHGIAAEYARIKQAHMQTTGHFFERRYHAVLVDTDSYMLQLIRYIHLNPVVARLAPDPSSFPGPVTTITWASGSSHGSPRNSRGVCLHRSLRELSPRISGSLRIATMMPGSPATHSS